MSPIDERRLDYFNSAHVKITLATKKKARAGGMPAYAPTAKEREIVEKARLRDAPQEWSRQYAMLGLILAS